MHLPTSASPRSPARQAERYWPAMSQQNVEFVQRLIAAFNSRDVSALAEFSHEELEFVSVLTAVDAEGATHRGKEAWASYFSQMDDTWAEWQAEDARVFDAGDDCVAAVFRLVGTGRHSGVPVEHRIGIVYRIQEGKLWRLRTYLDPSEALEAVGLAE